MNNMLFLLDLAEGLLLPDLMKIERAMPVNRYNQKRGISRNLAGSCQ